MQLEDYFNFLASDDIRIKGHRSAKERAKNPHPATQRLLKIKAELDTYPPEERAAALQRILAREKREEAVVFV